MLDDGVIEVDGIGVEENAEHPGGLNIFGRGFGNHDQHIAMRQRP